MPPTLVPSLFAAVALLAPVAAQPLIAQLNGIANPAQVIDFGANLYPNFTPITTQFTGLTVSHASYYTTGSVNNIVGGFLTNDFSGSPNTLVIQFAAPIFDLSFVYHQISTAGPSTIRALLQGVVVDSFSGTWNQSQPNNYFGFTNLVFDELQIDFQSDFNVDTLAFNPVPTGGAQCFAFNGTGVNPAVLACTTLPQLGTTWQGAIGVLPNTLLAALAFAPGGIIAPLPLFGGELLVDPAPSLTLFTSAGSFAFAIPAAPLWTGTVLTFQGLRLDDVGGVPTIVPLNAIELLLGP